MARSKAEKGKPNDLTICILHHREEYQFPLPGRQCASKVHKHTIYSVAKYLVDQGMAEWIRIKIVKTSRHGKIKEEDREVPAVRLVPRRTWKGRVSDRRGGAPMKVMQLVE